jgi:hypothetical protein
MCRRRLYFALAAAALAFAATTPSRAELLISVDKSRQQMTVMVDGMTRYVWPVSTGVSGYDTPSGAYKPFRMEEDHFSREWDDAPMPHSIFFTQQGHAIHGSGHVKAMGTPASHGCVRLEPRNAAILFALVRQEKMANTRVVLSGETPVVAGVPVARRAPSSQRSYSNNEYQRSYGNTDDEEFTGTLSSRRQRPARGWRDANDGSGSYYYRERPYYPPPPQFFPFGR